MITQPLIEACESRPIIDLALNAHSETDVRLISDLIVQHVGARFSRPLGNRVNNHGLMGGKASSYDALLVELQTNGIDSVLEFLARQKYPNVKLSAMPWKSPKEAAQELLVGKDKETLGKLVQVHLHPADSRPSSSKQITPVIRDFGVGLTPAMVPETIFRLGSVYKDALLWQHGAYGLGGAMTYRNAKMVVLVTRRQPTLLKNGEDDRITVAVCEWVDGVKGEGLHYLVTSDWANNRDAEPWSVPASEYEDFEPGLHLALIGFQTKKFYGRRTDRDSFENMLQSRVSSPVLPIGIHNHVAEGDHFKIPEGNRSRFENNPRKDRFDHKDALIIDVGSKPYSLPIHWYVFRNGPNANIGGMRTFVWDKQAVHFTNNGYAHNHWSQQELRVKVPKLNQIWDRLHVVVETDALPIRERTKLFTPDRSGFRDTPTADHLEESIANFLQADATLQEINSELIRERISHAQTGPSTRIIAEKIAKALQTRGFGSMGSGTPTKTLVATPTKRPPKKLYPNPTTLEGPVSIWVLPGDTKHINLHLNSTDDFIPARGKLEISTSSGKVSNDCFSSGQLRKGSIRVQFAVPANCDPGEHFKIRFRVRDWVLASGGTAVGHQLEWETAVDVVAKPPAPTKPNPKVEKKKKRKGKGKRPNSGSLVAVLWEPVDKFESWDKVVPGHVDDIPASDLANHPDYSELAPLGDLEVQTIWLNKDYSPLIEYEKARISSRGASEIAIGNARDRYTLGVGVALVELANKRRVAEANGSPYDEEHYKHGRHAAAKGVIALLPEYDALVKAAGIDD